MADRHQIEMAIAAQEALRGTVPDEVVDITIEALRRQVAALDVDGQRRRQVTVMFADISGFTSMSERMDPELVANLMNDIWARLDVVVAKHGGRIDKHIGDALMAVWGTDVVREDDPERAVWAALQIQSAVVDFCRVHAVALAVRVGVNTGSVLLGPVGAGAREFTVMGDAVNVASRLEQAASPGGVLISHDTYRHVRGQFDVQPPTALVLKGKTDPVIAYAVNGATPRTFRVARGVEGVDTDTIGRDAEFARLTNELTASAAHRGVRLVTVVGDAGVGKSRLASDFRTWLESRGDVFVLAGRATRGQDVASLGLLRDAIAARFEILQSDDPATVWAKLREGLASALSASQADVTGYWLGFAFGASDAVTRISGAPELAAVGRAHLLTWLASITRERTAVLLCEDVHWADDETLALLEALRARDDVNLVVVALARPTLFERRPDWPDGAHPVTRIDLHPLDPQQCRRLVREVLKRVDRLPERLEDFIVTRAGGNPFYVEELVKMFIDDGLIRVGGFVDAWQVDVDLLDETRVPGTLSGVLQARLDAVPALEKVALQHAAVIGRVFWDRAVEALAGSPAGTSRVALAGAHRRELIRHRSGSSFAGCEEYAFGHALLRDVTYETVLLRDRPELHRRAAGWIGEAAGGRIDEYAEMIADHLRLAGDASAAADQLWRAGQVLADTGHHSAAARAVQRAFSLWDQAGSETPPQAYEVLGRALRTMGDLERAAMVFERGAAALPDRCEAAAALYCSASIVASLRGEHGHEGRLLASARAAAADDDFKGRSLIETRAAWWHLALGRTVEASSSADLALVLATAAGDRRLCAMAEAVLAAVAVTNDDIDAALVHAERERTHAAEVGDLYNVAQADSHRGVFNHLLADAGRGRDHYLAAMRAYSDASELYGKLGTRPAAAYVRANLAQATIRLGQPELAREHLRHAMRDAVDTGSTVYTFLCLQVEADRLITLGHTADGISLLGRLRSDARYSIYDDQETARVLSRVDLPAADVERLLAGGRSLNLEAVIAGIVAEPMSSR
jgi:class 3 adenylate cyclase/tetratricopeptide (TPR) repeat protein